MVKFLLIDFVLKNVKILNRMIKISIFSRVKFKFNVLMSLPIGNMKTSRKKLIS